MIGPETIEGRKLINQWRAIFIAHVATLNIGEMFSVPEITAFCML